MFSFSCGDLLRFGRYEPGTAGCLVRFSDMPGKVLLLTAGHAVLPPFAQPGDAITSDSTGDIIGRLFSWTSIDGDPTSDAALIWVDPAKVSPALRGLATPNGINLQPAVGETIRIVPHGSQQGAREARIQAVGQDIAVRVQGPDWGEAPVIPYRGQILTDHLISAGGDSGAVAVDAQGRVVGMVVAGSPDTGTVITPISAILANTAWGGRQLELVTDIGNDAVGPPLPAAGQAAPASVQGDVFRDPAARAEMLRALPTGEVAPGRADDPDGAVFAGGDAGSMDTCRGYRNNNPGNIRIGEAWRGLAVPADMTERQRAETSFCVFREPEWGLRAMAYLLRVYKHEHKLDTPRKIITRWAPPGDNNNVESYSGQVAAALGIDRDDFVDLDDKPTLLAVMRAMARHENGKAPPYAPMQYETALLLLHD